MARDLEEFLRRAAQRRTQQQRPENPQPMPERERADEPRRLSSRETQHQAAPMPSSSATIKCFVEPQQLSR